LPAQARTNPTFAARYDVASWQLLGAGGYAYVGAIYCRDVAEVLAVKIYSRLIPPERQDRVRDEVRNARRINHPTILRIHTPFFTDELHWIEMEMVRGQTLEKVLADAHGQPLTFRTALDIATALLEGLQAAHAAEVVHRDIKPENLILPEGGDPPVKILDFGISRAGEAVSLTPSTFPGSPLYAAPECHSPTSVVGSPADIYSAALVLYKLFTGQYPFPLPNDYSVLHLANIHSRRVGIEPRAPRYLVDGPFPPTLDEILVHALALAPGDRPTAGDLLDVLRRVPDSPDRWQVDARPYLQPTAPVAADAPVGTAEQPHSPTRATPRAPFLLLTGVLALVVAGWAGSRVLRRPPAPAAIAEPVVTLPTPPPAAPREQFHATWLGEGSITLTSALEQPATISLAVPDTPYRCCDPAIRLEPGSSILVWSSRWQPPLPADPPVRAIQITGSSGAGQINTTIQVE